MSSNKIQSKCRKLALFMTIFGVLFLVQARVQAADLCAALFADNSNHVVQSIVNPALAKFGVSSGAKVKLISDRASLRKALKRALPDNFSVKDKETIHNGAFFRDLASAEGPNAAMIIEAKSTQDNSNKLFFVVGADPKTIGRHLLLDAQTNQIKSVALFPTFFMNPKYNQASYNYVLDLAEDESLIVDGYIQINKN